MERAELIQKMKDDGYVIICSKCYCGATRLKNDKFQCPNTGCSNDNVTNPDYNSVKNNGFQFKYIRWNK